MTIEHWIRGSTSGYAIHMTLRRLERQQRRLSAFSPHRLRRDAVPVTSVAILPVLFVQGATSNPDSL